MRSATFFFSFSFFQISIFFMTHLAVATTLDDDTEAPPPTRGISTYWESDSNVFMGRLYASPFTDTLYVCAHVAWRERIRIPICSVPPCTRGGGGASGGGGRG